jgi:RNA recognition motif-containing protein
VPEERAGSKRRVDPALVRAAAGSVWVDETLASFPPDDFRIFVGDLGIEVNDALLSRCFAHYGSFAMARVVRDKKTALSKGFGFVSFLDHEEGLRALKEMNGRYCGNRPMKLKKGQWQKRSLGAQKKRDRRI